MCKSCRRQTSLTAGTVFHKTKTPLLKWFWVIYRMSTVPEADVCIADMQRDLKIKDYKTIWFMVDKVRKSLRRQDPPYKLVGLFRVSKSRFYADSSDWARPRDESETAMILAVSTKVGNSFGDEVPAFAQAFMTDDISTGNIENHLKKLNFPIYDIKRLIEFTRLNGWLKYGAPPFIKGFGEPGVIPLVGEVSSYYGVILDRKYARKLVPWALRLIEQAKHDVGVPRGGVSDKNLYRYISGVRDRLNHPFGPSESFYRLLNACTHY